jgi:hypothetical protein
VEAVIRHFATLERGRVGFVFFFFLFFNACHVFDVSNRDSDLWTEHLEKEDLLRFQLCVVASSQTHTHQKKRKEGEKDD